MNGALRHTMAAITSAVLAIQVAISIPGAPLSALVLSFMVYGFAGWLWESTVCAMLNHGSFSNSGLFAWAVLSDLRRGRACLLVCAARHRKRAGAVFGSGRVVLLY